MIEDHGEGVQVTCDSLKLGSLWVSRFDDTIYMVIDFFFGTVLPEQKREGVYLMYDFEEKNVCKLEIRFLRDSEWWERII